MATKNTATKEETVKTTNTNKNTQSSSAPHSEKTNTLAIIALIVSILLFVIFPLLGLILGIIALVQIKKSGENGKGLSIASIIISAIGLVINIIGLIMLLTLGSFFGAFSNTGFVNTKNGSVNFNDNGNSVSIGDAKVPSGFPKSVPIYPGSKVILSSKTNDGTYSVSLTTTDSKNKVDSYYESELSKNGWVTTDGSAIDFGTFSGTSLKNGNQKLGLITSANENKNETLITITVENQ